MTKTLLLPILFTSWYLFWFVYNYFLVTKEDQRKTHPRSIFFAFYIYSLFIVLISGHQKLFVFPVYVSVLTIFLVLTVISRNRYLVMGMNSITQMTWLYAIFTILNNNIINTAIVFTLAHLLVVFLKHVNLAGKFILVIASFIGGLVLAATLWKFNYPLNFIFVIIIHAGFYQVLRPIDRKYRFNIVCD